MSLQNWHKEFDEFSLEYLKVSNLYTLMGCFWGKYLMFELRKYRRIWCKLWRKTELWFGKWNEEFDKFSTEYSKVSKLELLLGAFIQKRKFMSLKFTGEMCVIKVNLELWNFENEKWNLKSNWLVSSKLIWWI